MTAGDKKKVRLMLGDGPNRVEIGEAEVTEEADGSYSVDLTVDDPNAPPDLKGVGLKMSGTIPPMPRLPWVDED
jgi:hypothetical protein